MTKEEFAEFKKIEAHIAIEAYKKTKNLLKWIAVMGNNIVLVIAMTAASLTTNNVVVIETIALSIYFVLVFIHLATYLLKCAKHINLKARKELDELNKMAGRGKKLSEIEKFAKYFQKHMAH